jgi:hypothetical protein
MANLLPPHVTVALDPVHLQAPALAFKGKVTVPGMIAAPEDEQTAHRGRYFRRVVVEFFRAQDAQPATTALPGRVEIKQHGDELVLRIRVNVAIGTGTALSAHRHHSWVLTQVHGEFAAHRGLEIFTEQFIHEPQKRRSGAQTRERKATVAIDAREILDDCGFAIRLQNIANGEIFKRLGVERRSLELRKIKHSKGRRRGHVVLPQVINPATPIGSHRLHYSTMPVEFYSRLRQSLQQSVKHFVRADAFHALVGAQRAGSLVARLT